MATRRTLRRSRCARPAIQQCVGRAASWRNRLVWVVADVERSPLRQRVAAASPCDVNDALDVELADLAGILGDELEASRDVLAHQIRDHAIAVEGVRHGDAQRLARL